MTRRAAGLSAEHTKAGRLQHALLDLLGVHERQGTLPTSIRFLFYELIQAGVVLKAATGARRADQDTIEALTYLREVGLVAWEWIVDETRRTPNRFRPVGFPGHSDRTRPQGMWHNMIGDSMAFWKRRPGRMKVLAPGRRGRPIYDELIDEIGPTPTISTEPFEWPADAPSRRAGVPARIATEH